MNFKAGCTLNRAGQDSTGRAGQWSTGVGHTLRRSQSYFVGPVWVCATNAEN